MESNTHLQSLARSLSDDERRYLHDRIVQSLSISKSAEDQSLHRGEIDKEQRAALVRREISEFSLFQRIMFALRKLVTREDDESLFIAMRLARLKRPLRRGGRKFIDVDHTLLGPDFGIRLFELYRTAYPVIPLVRMLWRKSDLLRAVVEFHLRRNIPDAKYELEQFVSLNEMLALYRNRQKKSDIRSEVLKRLSAYMAGIHADVFKQIADGILPLYHLRGLGLFPFDELFELFGVSIDWTVPQETPRFQTAEFAMVLPYLERLYYGLYLASKHGQQHRLHDDVLRYYLLLEHEGLEALEGADPVSLERKIGDLDNGQVSGLQERIARLYESADEALLELPLVELIKTIHEDPYYRLMVYLPRLNLEQFYQAALKMQLLNQLDEVFPKVRLGVINAMIYELFGSEPPEFEFYRPSIQQSVSKLGAPGFKHMRSLQVVGSFVREVYRPELVELFRLLSRVVPVRVKESGRDLLTVATGIEEIAEKIHLFDLGFSPDSDEGKTFYRLRYAVEKDLRQQRAYEKFVTQKDREARVLLDRTLERISEIISVLKSIRSASSPALNAKYAAMQTGAENGRQTFDATLDRQITRLETLRTLLSELMAIEGGS